MIEITPLLNLPEITIRSYRHGDIDHAYRVIREIGTSRLMQMMGAFAEFERSLDRQRTREGANRAKPEGRTGGRPSKLTAEQRKHALAQPGEGRSQAEVARLFHVNRAIVYRLAQESGA